MKRSPLFALLALLSPAALAQDEGGSSGSGSIDDLLGSIPEIEDQAPADAAPPPPPPEATFPEYTKAVNKALLKAWAPKKKALKDPKAEARFTLMVDAEGQITGVRPLSLSGDKHFDQSCLDAISATDALPPPPPSLRGSASQGLVVVFPATWAIKKAGG